MSLRQRGGVFRVQASWGLGDSSDAFDVIYKRLEAATQNMVVIRCEYKMQYMAFEFEAIGPVFDEVGLAETWPMYKPVFDYSDKPAMFAGHPEWKLSNGRYERFLGFERLK